MTASADLENELLALALVLIVTLCCMTLGHVLVLRPLLALAMYRTMVQVLDADLTDDIADGVLSLDDPLVAWLRSRLRVQRARPGVPIRAHQIRTSDPRAGALVDRYLAELDAAWRDYLNTRHGWSRVGVRHGRRATGYDLRWLQDGMAADHLRGSMKGSVGSPAEDAPSPHAARHGAHETVDAENVRATRAHTRRRGPDVAPTPGPDPETAVPIDAEGVDLRTQPLGYAV